MGYDNSHVKLCGRFLRHFKTDGTLRDPVERLHATHLEAWTLVGEYPYPNFNCQVSDTCHKLIALSNLERPLTKEEAQTFLKGVTDLVHRWDLHDPANKAVWATEEAK